MSSKWWPAALASSQLVWALCAEYAWPPNSTAFSAVLLGGIALSYLLCYLIPAMLGRELAGGHLSIPQWLALPARAALVFGAASSICWTFTWAPLWLLPAAATVIALRDRGPVVLAACGFGLLAALLSFHWPGIRDGHLGSNEAYRGDDPSVFLGIVLAGVPASLLAFREGRDSNSQPFRMVAIRGILLHAAPFAVSATSVCWGFVAGVRMYWKPSIPAGPEYGLGWIGITWGFKTLFATWTLLALAPLCVWLLWTRAAIGPLKQLTPASIALFAGAVALAWMRVHAEDARFLQGYDTAWGWTVLALSLLFGCYRVVRDLVTRSAISRN
jgi:hypothetical protein